MHRELHDQCRRGGSGVVAAYALVSVTVGARATVHDELSGLDLSEHGEEAYFGGDVGAAAGPGISLGGGVIVPARPAPSASAAAAMAAVTVR